MTTFLQKTAGSLGSTTLVFMVGMLAVDVYQSRPLAETQTPSAEEAQRGKVAVTVRVKEGRDEEQQFTPGNGKIESFQDCIDSTCTSKGPEMVVVPAGSFLMGSPDGEGDSYEHPRHKVTIDKPFAVGRTHITRGEFATFVRATEYKAEGGCYSWTGTEGEFVFDASWRSPGFEQDDTHPVVCVNWNDAKAYVKWLSGVTGKTYRLMSEAEAEYVARGLTEPRQDQPRYFFGNDETDLCTYGNGTDEAAKAKMHNSLTYAPCNDGHVFTAPVANFKQNAFGLYDVHGNVWSWTEDRYHDKYDNPPTDGSAWTAGDSSSRVLRGGSWYDSPQFLRSAVRGWHSTVGRGFIVGFRLARTLNP